MCIWCDLKLFLRVLLYTQLVNWTAIILGGFSIWNATDAFVKPTPSWDQTAQVTSKTVTNSTQPCNAVKSCLQIPVHNYEPVWFRCLFVTPAPFVYPEPQFSPSGVSAWPTSPSSIYIQWAYASDHYPEISVQEFVISVTDMENGTVWQYTTNHSSRR